MDAVVDIPIVLPPLVLGLSLLILFRQDWPGSWMPGYATPWGCRLHFVGLLWCWLSLPSVRLQFDDASHLDKLILVLNRWRGPRCPGLRF